MQEQFRVLISCLRCGQQGWILWQEGEPACEMIDISPGFYQRITSAKHFGVTETVCSRCGSIHSK